MLRLDATDLTGITDENELWDYRGNVPRLLRRLYNANESNKVSTLELIRMVEQIQSLSLSPKALSYYKYWNILFSII